MIKVTYIYHSGYLVETETAMFLFDYYTGKLPVFKKEKDVYVFASHSHHDHYNKDIFKLHKEGAPITYVLSDDITGPAPDSLVNYGIRPEQVVYIGAGDEVNVGKCNIKALRSTDEGVAFLVHYNDLSVYHAGDLQWWHWNGETKAFNEMMKRKYQYEIDRLQAEEIDVAFLVLDPRLEDAYYYGFDYFMKNTNTKVAFPMHLWDDYGTVKKMAREPIAEDYRDKIKIVEKKEQEFVLD